MVSGLVFKYLNGERFVIRRGYETARPVSTEFNLTVPLRQLCTDNSDNRWTVRGPWLLVPSPRA